MNFQLQKPVLLVFMVLALLPVFGASYDIDARVDKTEVGFGESLILQVTITQELENGGGFSYLTPKIDNFPGFDIVSTKTGHSTSFVNNYGVSRSQIVYELVPQKPGDYQIPAISFTDPEGKTHSTEPISIKVLPPRAESDESDPATAGAGKDRSSFRLFLIFGVILLLLVGTPMVLIAIGRFSSGGWTQKGDDSIEDAEVVEEVKTSADFKQPEPEKIDFFKQADTLKKQYVNVDNEFYRKYFELFKNAIVNGAAGLTTDLTFDELLQKVCGLTENAEAKSAAQRLLKDIELVMYANSKPSRGFAQIEEDIRVLITQVD